MVLWQRAQRSIPGGVNSNVRLYGEPCPLTFTRAEGSHIWDVDGNEYLDFVMGMGPHILGHNPRVVVESVYKSLDQGQLFGGQHRYEIELAELFLSIIPWVEQIRIGLSGTEMNLLAIRIARAHTGKNKIVRFTGHYHGWLDPLFINPIATPPMSQNALLPGQSLAAANDILLSEWNDLNALRNTFDSSNDISAVIMEPIMCNSGYIEPSQGYLSAVHELCRSHGIVLIVDEVITGFRIGLTGAQGHFGVSGDISIYAKAIASGFPVAILGASRELLAKVATGQVNHAGTYNTGISSTVAALATLTELHRTNPYDSIRSIGLKLMNKLSKLKTRNGIQLQTDGPGPMFQLRFGNPGPPTNLSDYKNRSDLLLLKQFITAWQHLGVRTTSRGMCFLSTAHTSGDIEFAFEKAEEAIATL